MKPHAEDRGVWIFGYGSLVWRPAFEFIESLPAWIDGWERRFWQGSTDHRGVPGAPGRVVTLTAEAGARCWGRAYRLGAGSEQVVTAQLDERERGGYRREEVPIYLRGQPQKCVSGLLYRAVPGNPNDLGDSPLADVAVQVREARGPSGTNLEYVRELASALRGLGVEEDPVYALEAELLKPGSRSRLRRDLD